MRQQLFFNSYKDIEKIISDNGYRKPLIVYTKTIAESFLIEYIDSLDINHVVFKNFTPNPKYDEILSGISAYNTNNCDFIIAIGGGSAIDVAKCINLFLTLDSEQSYLGQIYRECATTLLALPTTAGSGSESTRFAVIYYNDIKQSITAEAVLPEFVILEPKFLETLPDYQKKSTVLDSLCQSIESYWSVNSTETSKKYAANSIKLILENINKYINNHNDANEKIMLASNFSGRAINITQTTAAHAMSYKITSMYGISHGHAVALCLPHIWEHMISNLANSNDSRGEQYLKVMFNELDGLLTLDEFKKIFDGMNLEFPKINSNDELKELVGSVNVTRLNNNPVFLSENDIEKIYKKIST